MLRREAEELQRQMEQMARNNSQGSSQQNSQGGSQGNSSSSSSGQSSGGGKQGSTDPRVQQASSRLGSLADETSRLAKEQRNQGDRIRQTFGQQGAQPGLQGGIQERRKLADDRQKLAEDLGRLEKELQDTARELATNKQNAASPNLREALGDMQQSDLRSRIQRGADWMRRGIDPNASGAEPEIAAGMQRLEKEVNDAQQALGANPQQGQGNDSQQGLETALNRVERLRNQMDSLTRDGQGRQQGQQQGKGQGQGQGQGGQQGQQGGQGASGPVGGPGARIGGGNNGGGYRYSNPGGGGVGTIYDNFDTGNNTPRGGPPVQPDNSPIPPQRAYDDSMRDLNQLRQAVQEDPEMARQVQELIRQMQRLDPSRFPGNPALVEQLHTQVHADVDKLELQLRRQLDDKQSGQVRSGDTRTVPAGYEDSVADYYRRLSKNK